jgi:2-C-methyl-D-erythritol 4-phosphate cytidylyltransferase
MKKTSHLSVIIAAAGSGTRMGGVSKPFLTLRRRTILSYSLETFASLPETREIIVVVSPRDLAAATKSLARAMKRCKISHIVQGGEIRQESVANGLKHVAPDAELIAVHDAARPFASAELVKRVITAALKHGAAIPAAPVKDTLKRAGKDGRVMETVPREGLWHVQTPQIFDAKLLRDAYKKYAHRGEFTDDALLVERMGHPVFIVPSDHTNLKITTPEDMLLARTLLTRGVGQGKM